MLNFYLLGCKCIYRDMIKNECQLRGSEEGVRSSPIAVRWRRSRAAMLAACCCRTRRTRALRPPPLPPLPPPPAPPLPPLSTPLPRCRWPRCCARTTSDQTSSARIALDTLIRTGHYDQANYQVTL